MSNPVPKVDLPPATEEKHFNNNYVIIKESHVLCKAVNQRPDIITLPFFQKMNVTFISF